MRKNSRMNRLSLLGGIAVALCAGLVSAQGQPPTEAAPVRVATSASAAARDRQMPVYPAALMAEKREGRVFASFDVDETGKTDDIRIERSSHPLFSQAVVDAVKGWRFDPPRGADGQAQRTRMQVPFRFLPEE